MLKMCNLIRGPKFRGEGGVSGGWAKSPSLWLFFLKPSLTMPNYAFVANSASQYISICTRNPATFLLVHMNPVNVRIVTRSGSKHYQLRHIELVLYLRHANTASRDQHKTKVH